MKGITCRGFHCGLRLHSNCSLYWSHCQCNCERRKHYFKVWYCGFNEVYEMMRYFLTWKDWARWEGRWLWNWASVWTDRSARISSGGRPGSWEAGRANISSCIFFAPCIVRTLASRHRRAPPPLWTNRGSRGGRPRQFLQGSQDWDPRTARTWPTRENTQNTSEWTWAGQQTSRQVENRRDECNASTLPLLARTRWGCCRSRCWSGSASSAPGNKESSMPEKSDESVDKLRTLLTSSWSPSSR